MKASAVLSALILVGACGGDVGSRGRQLADELGAAFPDRITGAIFDTDDDIVFVDVAPMSPLAELNFLCDEIRPMLPAGIEAATDRWFPEDCPS